MSLLLIFRFRLENHFNCRSCRVAYHSWSADLRQTDLLTTNSLLCTEDFHEHLLTLMCIYIAIHQFTFLLKVWCIKWASNYCKDNVGMREIGLEKAHFIGCQSFLLQILQTKGWMSKVLVKIISRSFLFPYFGCCLLLKNMDDFVIHVGLNSGLSFLHELLRIVIFAWKDNLLVMSTVFVRPVPFWRFDTQQDVRSCLIGHFFLPSSFFFMIYTIDTLSNLWR